MVTALIATLIALSPQSPDPGLPTPPPQLPTQIVNGDGTRMNCTPGYTQCWPAQ